MAPRTNRGLRKGVHVTYKDIIKTNMELLAADPTTIFIGYNLKNGSKCYGTMADIPTNKIIEMPVAEALMAGMATGLALSGMKPVLIFERHDFMLLSADQIINHLDKINQLSHGDFKPKVIIRAIIGHDKPFDPGLQHKGNFTNFFMEYCKFDIANCENMHTLALAYKIAETTQAPIMIVEHRRLY